MQAYTDLNKQFIGGEWMDGTEQPVIENINPYTVEVIHTLKPAGKKEVGTAYEAEKNAFQKWSTNNPLYRRDLLLKAAELILIRKEEFAAWLTKETGSTYTKAIVEVQQSHDILVEASSFPTTMHGLTLNSTIDDKETYVYRKPLGVIGALISASLLNLSPE